MNDFSTTFTVNRSPEEVFAAINDVRSWWTGEITGGTDQLGAEFTYAYDDLHRSTHKVVELVAGTKVVWLVTDSRLSFTADPAEWTGTEIVFDISRKGNATEVRFTHVGLEPAVECFESCSSAWGHYINGGLRARVINGSPRACVVGEPLPS
jgi:hypothetical protein